MITLEQLKKKIIKIESEWRSKVHEDAPEFEEEQMYIQGMIDEINDCNSIEDILIWYSNSGYDSEEATHILLDMILEHGEMKS